MTDPKALREAAEWHEREATRMREIVDEVAALGVEWAHTGLDYDERGPRYALAAEALREKAARLESDPKALRETPTTPIDIVAIEARAKAAQRYERADGPAGSGDQWWTCPLCDGDGEVEGTLYDAKEHASTIAAYGIGVGLGRAEAFVEHAADDVLALLREVERLRAEIAAAVAAEREACAALCETEATNRITPRLRALGPEMVPGDAARVAMAGELARAIRARGGR